MVTHHRAFGLFPRALGLLDAGADRRIELAAAVSEGELAEVAHETGRCSHAAGSSRSVVPARTSAAMRGAERVAAEIARVPAQAAQLAFPNG